MKYVIIDTLKAGIRDREIKTNIVRVSGLLEGVEELSKRAQNPDRAVTLFRYSDDSINYEVIATQDDILNDLEG